MSLALSDAQLPAVATAARAPAPAPRTLEQDIAIRLANEGVPIRAIARAVRLPSAKVRLALEEAQHAGYLIEIPCEDWPAGPASNRKLRKFSRLLTSDREELQRLLRITFGLTPALSELLLLLLLQREVNHEYRGCSRTLLGVQIHWLRQQLRDYQVTISTMHGNGYYIDSTNRQRALDLLIKAG